MKSKTTHFQRKQVRARQELFYWRCDRILNRVFIRRILGILLATSVVIWGFSSFWQVPFSFSQSNSVVINEIMYDPAQPDGCTDSESEWVELFNSSGDAVYLDGWTIWDLNSSDPLDGAVISGDYLVVVADQNCFKLIHPQVPDDLIFELADGRIGSGLNNTGSEDVVLRNAQYSNKVSYTASSTASGKSYSRKSDDSWQLADPTPGVGNSLPEKETKDQQQPQPTINFSAPATVSAGSPFSVSVTLKNFKPGTYFLKVLIGKGDEFIYGNTKGASGKWLTQNGKWSEMPQVTVGVSGSGSKAIQAKTDDDVVAGNYLTKVRAYDGKNSFDSDTKPLKVTGSSAPKSSSSGSEGKTQDSERSTGEVGEVGKEGEVKGEETSQGEGFKLNFYTILGIFGMLVGGGGLILSFAKKRVPGPEVKTPPPEHSEERGSGAPEPFSPG